MAEKTGITWCDHTLNFWIGCQEVSPACDHCYARVQNEYRGWVGGWGPHGERRRTAHSTWHQLRTWNSRAQKAGIRAKVFSNSLSDFFDKAARLQWRREAWHYIDQCPWLDFLILTKRPQNIPGMLPDPETGVKPWGDGWPNVWLGTTAEDQQHLADRAWSLAQVPAQLRFLSVEPMLGQMDTRNVANRWGTSWDALTGRILHAQSGPASVGAIEWVIVGGESGKDARPMHPDWARSLRDQCAAAGVPFFFKQWGEWGTAAYLASTGTPVFRKFTSFDQWVNKAPTWVRGGIGLDRHGREMKNGADMAHARDNGNFPVTIMHRVGKKAAGDLLDGVQHHAWPSSPALQVAA